MDKSSSKWLQWNYEKKKKKLTETLELTLNMLKLGKTIIQIAVERELKLQTVEYQVIELITQGFVALEDIVSTEKINMILDLIKKGIPKSLKDIKEKLPEEISYFEIKCILADINRNP